MFTLIQIYTNDDANDGKNKTNVFIENSNREKNSIAVLP